MSNTDQIKQAFELASEQYSKLGVDAEAAIERMKDIQISLHCWQTDDVNGCETPDAALSGGGIQATGNYPGKAGNINEIRDDLEKVLR